MSDREGAASAHVGSQPSIATRIFVSLFVGLFVASLIWIALSEPIHLRPLGSLPLQYVISLIAAIPSALGLLRLFRNHPSPEQVDRLNPPRPRPLMLAVDVLAWASIALFLGF